LASNKDKGITDYYDSDAAYGAKYKASAYSHGTLTTDLSGLSTASSTKHSIYAEITPPAGPLPMAMNHYRRRHS